jgi:hypothetical protein
MAAWSLRQSRTEDTRARSIVEWDCFFNPALVKQWHDIEVKKSTTPPQERHRQMEDEGAQRKVLLKAIETMMVAHGTFKEL